MSPHGIISVWGEATPQKPHYYAFILPTLLLTNPFKFWVPHDLHTSLKRKVLATKYDKLNLIPRIGEKPLSQVVVGLLREHPHTHK